MPYWSRIFRTRSSRSERVCASTDANGSSISRISGPVREPAGARHALLDAAGELPRVAVLEPGQADRSRACGRRRGAPWTCAAAGTRRSWRRSSAGTASDCSPGPGGAGCAPAGTVPERGVTGSAAGRDGTHFVGIAPGRDPSRPLHARRRSAGRRRPQPELPRLRYDVVASPTRARATKGLERTSRRRRQVRRGTDAGPRTSRMARRVRQGRWTQLAAPRSRSTRVITCSRRPRTAARTRPANALIRRGRSDHTKRLLPRDRDSRGPIAGITSVHRRRLSMVEPSASACSAVHNTAQPGTERPRIAFLRLDPKGRKSTEAHISIIVEHHG